MTPDRNSSGRRCLRATEWPAADRIAWEHALRHGDYLDEAGHGATWSIKTVETYEKAYGRYLDFLENSGDLDPNEPIAVRITPDRIFRFVKTLKSQVASYTVWSMLASTEAAISAMVPDRDWTWLRSVVRRLNRRTKRSRLPSDHYIHPRTAYVTGLQLIADAEADTSLSPVLRATRVRDGLMLAHQAARPLRISNLAGIEIDRNLTRISSGYALAFDSSETKNRRPIEFTLPDTLIPGMDRYLSEYRQILEPDPECRRLWISKYGNAMTVSSVSNRFAKLTPRLFRIRVSPHDFRYNLATAIALDDPDHVRMAADLLGHAAFSTTDKHYIMARQIEASRRYRPIVDCLDDLNRRIEDDD